jgi:hypothetical protein
MKVATREASRVLNEILAREGYIDILKLNIEGMEIPVLKSLRPDKLDRIGVICAEIFDFPGELPGFRSKKYGRNITRFENKKNSACRSAFSHEDRQFMRTGTGG